MKTKREMQFLTYLDALERGDAEGISAFLVLAEADAELEKMLMDYHTESSPEEEKPKVITPFKRKREDANRWMQRFGSGLIAALMMILVGGAGVIIGAGGFDSGSTSADGGDTNRPNEANVANVGDCTAEIVSDENQITLLAYGDIDRTMTVGVNNPFVITLNTGRSGSDYSGIFEGLLVTITRRSLELHGDCSTVRNLTVYPKDDPNKICNLELDRLSFPIERYTMSMYSMGHANYGDSIVLLDAPIDGAYPIRNLLFDGRLPAEYVQMEGSCTSFPLLYQQEIENILPPQGDTYPTIELHGMRISEQSFEHGTMFYLEPMGQIWVACGNADTWVSWIALPAELSVNAFGEAEGNPPEGLFEPQAGFIAPWQFVSRPQEDAICDMGWATSRIATFDSAYSYVVTENEVIHTITSQSGERFSFHIVAEQDFFWTMNEE